MGSEYDAENIFAKLIDNKEPCFKVFESRNTLAFLDVFPVTEGHTVVIPKSKGHVDFLAMPAGKAADFLADIQRVARAVKQGTGATAVNIWQNNGADAGQTVFHPHFHIIPRKAGDGLQAPFTSKGEKLSEDAAKPLLGAMTAALNPPKKLRKPKYGKISGVTPDSSGLNLKVKVVGDCEVVESKAGKFWEVLCGDASGTVILSLRENQKDLASKDAVLEVRNAAAKMVKGHVRLAVDKWGKISSSDEGMEDAVEMSPGKNVSATEYELVTGK